MLESPEEMTRRIYRERVQERLQEVLADGLFRTLIQEVTLDIYNQDLAAIPPEEILSIWGQEVLCFRVATAMDRLIGLELFMEALKRWEPEVRKVKDG